MYYSLTFDSNGVQKNTWADWGLIPDTPPMIPPPKPNYTFVDIPGRPGGPLDLTGIPFGRLTYKRIQDSWNFLREPTNRRTRVELYEELEQFFIGKVVTVKMEEDLNHYYKGRFEVSKPKTGIGPIQFTISFDLEPVRYNVVDDSIDTTFAPETI